MEDDEISYGELFLYYDGSDFDGLLRDSPQLLLLRQFENEHGRRSWEKKDHPSRLKFVEDCIRMDEVFEMKSKRCKEVSGLEETLSAIRNGEEMLLVENVKADDVKVIAEELKTNTSLLGLKFRYCEIGVEGARHLSDMLRQNSTLLHLDILRKEIGPDGAMGPDGARHLSDALRENSTLLSLDIAYHRIGDDGARHLSDMLRQNSSLLFLDIGANGIGDEGAQHVSDALRQNSTILILYLYKHWISDEGARHLSDALRQNSTLLMLDIWGGIQNGIGSEGARHLSNALRQNCTLLNLDIDRNPIGPEGALHLSDMLRQNSTLLHLHLCGCDIGDEGARHLSDALRENSTLLYLDIAYNSIKNMQLKDEIREEIRSRNTHMQYRDTTSRDSKGRSFDDCRVFLQEYLNQLTSSSGLSSPSISIGTIPSSSAISSSSTTTITSASSSSTSTSTSVTPALSASSSSASICLDSTTKEFLDYCAGLKKWTEKIVQSLSSTLIDEECLCSVETLLESWMVAIAPAENVKLVLKKQMWDILISIFPATEFSPSYPAFYAWNSNATFPSPASSSSSSSQPPVHPSHSEHRFLGAQVGAYMIHSEIHRGPENIVFRIEHERTKVSFALKLYSSVESRNRERDMLGALPSYLGIVLFKGSFDLSSSELKALSLDDKYSPACVFELGESSLLHAYQSASVHDQDLKLSWIKEAAKALSFVHDSGLIHLDIKPSNYMFFRDGPIFRLKLIDFDCCRHHGDVISPQEYAPGTPMFASPEVLHHNQKQNDDLLIEPSLDVYSFGSFAYYLLSGTPLPVDVARICLKKDLSNNASMSDVADVMLHPKCKVENVLKAAVDHTRISEQQASMLRQCLVDRVSMADILKHTFFGVEFAPTYLRDIESKAQFTNVLDLSWYINVNDVTIGRKIGQGFFGNVFEGHYQHMRVAVKQIKRIADEENLLKFKEELALMSKLHHENVVRLYGAFENPDLHIVMEFCDSNLKSYLLENAYSLTESKAYDLILEIAHGMSFLHAEGRCIIHRDLKPDNILLRSEGTFVHCKVSDFGLSRIIRDPNDETHTSCGTPLYMAPEVVRGDKYDFSVDVYSFGLIMWEIFHCCFEHEYKIALWKHKDLETRALLFRIGINGANFSFPVTFPKIAIDLITSCCNQDPRKRPSFSEIVSRLRELSPNRDGAEYSSDVDQVPS